MYKDMITKEIMQECINQGMTQTEMAIRLDTSFETIHRLLKQYDLKPAYNHDTGKYDEEKMKRCLQQGMTAKEIAQAFDVISTTVSRWKKKYNLDIQPTPRTPRKKKVTDCRTCIYRARGENLPYKCNYLEIAGHTRNMGQETQRTMVSKDINNAENDYSDIIDGLVNDYDTEMEELINESN